jgi:hypothetical protein
MQRHYLNALVYRALYFDRLSRLTNLLSVHCCPAYGTFAGAPSRQHFQHQGGIDRQMLAALSSDSAGWGEARPDWLETCLDQDQDAPGQLTDLDAEWQVRDDSYRA